MKMSRDPVWLAEVGHRLVLARDAVGKKQAAMARSLGISVQRLSNYERGKRPFDIELAIELSRKHAITMDFIYWGDLRGLPFHLAAKLSDQMLPTGFDQPKH
jgi:DNA-binding XRE family transcriptional regulator